MEFYRGFKVKVNLQQNNGVPIEIKGSIFQTYDTSYDVKIYDPPENVKYNLSSTEPAVNTMMRQKDVIVINVEKDKVESLYPTIPELVIDLDDLSDLSEEEEEESEELEVNPQIKQAIENDINKLTEILEKLNVQEEYEPTIEDLIYDEFVLNLREKWKHFIFRNVKKTITNPRNLNSIRYWYIENEYKNVPYMANPVFVSSKLMYKYYNNIEQAREEIQNEDLYRNLEFNYSTFHGYTYPSSIHEGPTFLFNKDIRFNSETFDQLNFDDDGTLLFKNFSSQYAPVPKPGSLICGTVSEYMGKPYFTKWFISSYQFHLLWTLVCDPKNTKMLYTKNEKGELVPKKISDIVKELDTGRIWNMYNVPPEKRPNVYVYRNYESAALQYSNRYIDVFDILFNKDLREEIDLKLDENLKTPLEHNPTFIENIYLSLK